MKKNFNVSGIEFESEITKFGNGHNVSFMARTRSLKHTYEMTNMCDSEEEAEKMVETHVKHIVSMFAPSAEEVAAS